MERPEEVETILKHLGDEWSVDYVILVKYIQSLELMVDAAYKTLEELDEVV